MDPVKIRTLKPADWPRLKEIYESGIATGMAIFETNAPSRDDWHSSHLPFSRLVSIRMETDNEILPVCKSTFKVDLGYLEKE